MFDEKGFIRFKDDEFEVVINYLNMGDHLLGITLSDSYKVKHFNENPRINVGNGIKPKEFHEVNVSIVDNTELTKEIFDKMTELKHNHFKEFDDRLVTVRVDL